jgi:hypothetical protein
MKRGLLVAALMVASVGVAAPSMAEQPPRAIYLLMGQSNMSGRGVLTEIAPGALDPDERIQLYGNDGRWRRAAEPLDTAQDQIDKVSSDPDGVGPGLAFAKAMLKKHPGRPIGLVTCAKGGSAIGEWKPSAERSTLYGSCLARAREAAPFGQIAGILWYQGETDARTDALARAWAGRFGEMIIQFRADLGKPDLPVAVVGIGDQPQSGKYAGQFPAWTTVQDDQKRLRLGHQVYVSAAGLARNPDELHLNTQSQVRLGQMLAAVMP